jgi:hypothetical protein
MVPLKAKPLAANCWPVNAGPQPSPAEPAGPTHWLGLAASELVSRGQLNRARRLLARLSYPIGRNRLRLAAGELDRKRIDSASWRSCIPVRSKAAAALDE